jgi:hypothetical protein
VTTAVAIDVNIVEARLEVDIAAHLFDGQAAVLVTIKSVELRHVALSCAPVVIVGIRSERCRAQNAQNTANATAIPALGCGPDFLRSRALGIIAHVPSR